MFDKDPRFSETLSTDPLREAARLMTVCNSCRYCEGLCAVFPAMELRRSFEEGDLNYLANLCHSCGACYQDCQFSPPHEFDVNVPQTLAKVRADSYRSYAWPKAFQPLFDRNGLAISSIAALSVAAFIAGFALWHDPQVLFSGGSFYKLMPHNVMALLFGAVFLYMLAAVSMGFRTYWKEIGAKSVSAGRIPSVWQAIKDAGQLRYLDGGGVGCYNEDEKPTDNRRLYHHLTFYGFLLCFAATSTGTIYHYAFGWEAPYGLFSLPKLFGVLGGVGLVIGPVGLAHAKRKRHPDLLDPSAKGMEAAFLVMLFATGLSGLLLMALRETPLMGVMLSLHLGVVFALFLTMPYGKFVHGIYRFGALVLYAAERKADRPADAIRKAA
ncbi:tricarballylate utilization 4Fe-4S protein TcuB [Roseibium aggregatum]|uniref:Tricarballylate utilization 4Fe-4S protein TcuB n=1 Tax=Roseibium aggregatum TaxID=187304 RepID=A0A939EGW5_9HYPH|nr:tricarballylate utilization 4Fe-4S protein TcuB [Roseibium aggregatum]MBN9671530.1 tricarballylate utilization 4Fe-4S protein TcuB [Roseibium aggregatum]